MRSSSSVSSRERQAVPVSWWLVGEVLALSIAGPRGFYLGPVRAVDITRGAS